jgi:hypothetical protein
VTTGHFNIVETGADVLHGRLDVRCLAESPGFKTYKATPWSRSAATIGNMWAGRCRRLHQLPVYASAGDRLAHVGDFVGHLSRPVKRLAASIKIEKSIA